MVGQYYRYGFGDVKVEYFHFRNSLGIKKNAVELLWRGGKRNTYKD